MSQVAVTSNRTSTPATGPVDSSAREAINDLPDHGPVNGEQTAKMIRRATEDSDGQAAGLEHTEVMKWARDNWERLTPEAKKMIERFDQEARESLAAGKTGIENDKWEKMMSDIDGMVPKHCEEKDASVSRELRKLDRTDGPVSGEQMRKAIERGAGDADGQAAGVEYDQFMKWASENRSRLTPEAQKVLDIYEKYARQAQARGETGIQPKDWEKMQGEMKAVKPSYGDEGAGKALDAINKKGYVSGEDLYKAIRKGTSDADNQAAGLEFNDFSKWAKDNAHRLGGSAKDVMAIYEKYAREAQAEGKTGIDPDDYKKMLKEMVRVIDRHNNSDDDSHCGTVRHRG